MSDSTEDLLKAVRHRVDTLEGKVKTLEKEKAHLKQAFDEVLRELAAERALSAAREVEMDKMREHMNGVMLDLLDIFILEPIRRSKLHIHNSCSSSLLAATSWHA